MQKIVHFFKLYILTCYFAKKPNILQSLTKVNKLHRKMYQDIKTALFDPIPYNLEIKLQKQQIEASCQFDINLEKIETDESIGFKMRKICLQIRDSYLIQYDLKKNLLVSAFQLNFHTKVQIQDSNFQNSMDSQKYIMKIGRIKSANINSMEDLSQQTFQQIPFQFSSEYQSKFKNFAIVLSIKPVIHEIKDLKNYFKPGEKSKIYEAYSINKKQKFIIKAYPKNSIQNLALLDCLLRQWEYIHMLRQNGAVRIQKVYSTKNTLYLVMPAYQGNLYQFSKVYGNEISNTQKITIKILKLLAKLHEKMIVHGKITLQHILINQQDGKIFQAAITGFECMNLFSAGKGQIQKGAQALQKNVQNKEFNAHAAKDIRDIGKIFCQLLSNKVELHMQEISDLALLSELKNMENIPKSALDLLQKLLKSQQQPKTKLPEIMTHQFFAQKYQLFQNSKINKVFP